MKKIHLFAIVLIGSIIAFSACSSTETYADKLKNQEKAIKKFISENGIEVIDYLPTDTIFGEKQYYKDPKTGVYIHVIDKGGRMIAEEDEEEVLLRMKGVHILGDTTTFDNTQDGMALYWMQFTYGNSTTYTCSTYSSYYSNEYYNYNFLSPGCALALRYVGENGKVSLIVPFGTVSGSAMQNSSYVPLFYGEVRYVF